MKKYLVISSWLPLMFVSSFCLWQIQTLPAQNVEVSASFDKDSILIGDQVTLTIIASYPKGANVIYPVFKDSIGHMEIVDSVRISTEEEKEGEKKTARIKLTAFDPGQYNIYGIPLIYQDQSYRDTLSVEPLKLFVNTVPIDTTKPFKEIKAPLKVPYTWKEILPWVLAGLAVLALVAAILYLLFRKKKEKAPEPGISQIDFHQLTLERLKQLDDEKLWQSGEIKSYYLRLSELFRAYLEKRYGIAALEVTTHEILDLLEKETLSDGMLNKAKSVLEIADLAKFAKFKPLPDENMMAMKMSLDFVTHTRSKPENEQKPV